MAKLIDNTDFIKLPLFTKGKVRNVYDLGSRLLIVVSDRISAFDVVFPQPDTVQRYCPEQHFGVLV